MKRVAGVLFLLTGLGAFAGAGWVTVSNLRFKARAVKAEGTVVKLERRTHTTPKRRGQPERTTVTWAPVFEFADASGATQRLTSSHSSSLSTYQVGGRVRVLYLAEEPEQARIDTFASFWPSPLILTGGGIAFVAIGFSFLRGARRH